MSPPAQGEGIATWLSRGRRTKKIGRHGNTRTDAASSLPSLLKSHPPRRPICSVWKSCWIKRAILASKAPSTAAEQPHNPVSRGNPQNVPRGAMKTILQRDRQRRRRQQCQMCFFAWVDLQVSCLPHLTRCVYPSPTEHQRLNQWLCALQEWKQSELCALTARLHLEGSTNSNRLIHHWW